MLTAEYEVLRQKMRAIASENLLSWMSDAWHDILMQIPQQDRNKAISQVRTLIAQRFENYERNISPGASNARADMKLALFREEFASVSAQMLETIERGRK